MLTLFLTLSRITLLPTKNKLWNPHNNERSSVDCWKTNLSTSACAYHNVVSGQISHSYDRTTSYPIYSVF